MVTKYKYGSSITGREKGCVVAYTGELFTRKWVSLVDGSNPTHTGQQNLTVDSIVGKATHFPVDDTAGARSYLTIPKKLNYTQGGAIAWSIRLTHVGGASNRQLLYAAGAGGTSTYYWIYVDTAGALYMYWSDSAALRTIGYTLPLGRWTRILVTWNTTSVQVYIDGNLQYTASGLTYTNDLTTQVFCSTAAGAGNLNQWDLADVLQTNIRWTATDARDDYMRTLGRKLLWQEDLVGAKASQNAEGGLVGGYLSNTQWQFGDTDGRWYVYDATVAGKACKSVKPSAGVAPVLYMPIQKLGIINPTTAAYGTWTFWIKPANVYRYMVGLCNVPGHRTTTGMNAYWMGLTSDRAAVLGRTDNGAWQGAQIATSDFYCAVNQWHKFTFTRRYDGSWTMYVNGVRVAAAVGTNPKTDTTYTTANYICLQADSASCEFALLSQKAGCEA